MKTVCIEPGDPHYPTGVRELPEVASWCHGRPPPIYVRGELPAGPAVAVIGSRDVPRAACKYARELAGTLASAGWFVVSGGAVGIDAAAHEGALEATGRTAAVVCGGLDLPPYPPKNAALLREMLRRGGAHVSLYPDGTRRQRFQFLLRNELMMSLCQAVVVVHARRDGGAIKAAAAARKLGRPTFFVPSAPWLECGGTLDALRRGEPALWCVEDAVAALAPYATSSPAGLNAVQQALWRASGQLPLHRDALIASAEVAPDDAATALLMLVLDGHLEEGPAGHFRRSLRL